MLFSSMASISLEEFSRLIQDSLPFARQLGVEVVELSGDRAVFRLPYREDFLRPGGTISGPMMMGLADLAMYGLVMSAIGRAELAVTTNLSINFLRRPPPQDLEARARLLKLGKRLAVGEVELYSAGEADMVAHVVATYSLPPDAVV